MPKTLSSPEVCIGTCLIGSIVTPYLVSVIAATLNSDGVKNIDPKVSNVILGTVNLISKIELSEIEKV